MTKPIEKQPDSEAEKALIIDRKEGESDEAAVARLKLRPAVNAAIALTSYNLLTVPDVEVQLPDLVNELLAQCEAVNRGELNRAEAMLIAQAHALDAIFASLARRASLNFGEYLNSAEKYMRLALKAQSQCRATLETLSTIKNPPVIIAKQANVTSGPQQINNGVAREIETKPNELLEQSNGKWLDTGAAGQAIGGNSEVEAVGTIHGTTDGGREGT
jgi:hypothetical protein